MQPKTIECFKANPRYIKEVNSIRPIKFKLIGLILKIAIQAKRFTILLGRPNLITEFYEVTKF